MARALLIRPDAEAQIQKFIDLNTAKAATAADWGALFPRFLEHANDYDARRNPQASIPIVIPGGKPEPPAPLDEPVEDPALAVGPSLEAQWARVRKALRELLGAAVYRAWIRDIELVGIEAGEVTIGLKSEFLASQVRRDYLMQITNLWRADNPDIVRVNIVAALSLPRPAAAG